MTSIDRDGIEALLALRRQPGPPELREAYLPMIDSLSGLLDAITGADLSIAEAQQYRARFDALAAELRERAVGEEERLWGHWVGAAGHGQTLVPKVYDQTIDGFATSGKVVFGRFHVGENMAAHGGAVSLLFDHVLGWLGLTTEPPLPPARTAYLKTNFRSVTPVGVELEIRARIDRIEGRKRFITAELCHGDVVCADAEGLWVELKPGQA